MVNLIRTNPHAITIRKSCLRQHLADVGGSGHLLVASGKGLTHELRYCGKQLVGGFNPSESWFQHWRPSMGFITQIWLVVYLPL